MIIDPNSSSWRERMEYEIQQVIINSGGVVPIQTDSSWKARTEELLKILTYLTISGGGGGGGGAAANLSNGIVTVQRRLTTTLPTSEDLAGLATSADGSDRASWFFIDNGTSYAGIYHVTGDVATPYQSVSQINGSHLEVGTLIYVESQLANGKGTYYQVDRKLNSDDDAIYSPFIDLSILEFAIAANTAQIAALSQQQSSNQSISNQPTPDPLFSSLGLLLPLRADFNDRSLSGRLLTSQGAVLSADTAKFGTQSAKFGSGTYLSFDGASNLNLPSDFLLEAWVYQTARPTEFAPILECLGRTSQGTGYSFGLRNGKVNFFDFVTDHTGNTAIPLNAWTHIAVWKCNSILSLWLNGVPDFATTNARNITAVSGNFRVGVNSWQEVPTFFLTGYVQDVRLTKAFRAPILPNNPFPIS